MTYAYPVLAFTPSPLSTKESRFDVRAVAGVHEILFYGYIGQWKDWNGNVVGVSKESLMAELDKIPANARVLARFAMSKSGTLKRSFGVSAENARLAVRSSAFCADALPADRAMTAAVSNAFAIALMTWLQVLA